MNIVTIHRLPTLKRLALVSALLVAVSAHGETGASVGEVSLVLGKAYIRTQGKEMPVRAGTQVRVSDEIITEANGHVHIEFVDKGLLSVRPDSRLEIQRYDFDPAKPSESSIKLNLLEGVTRSISGDGAHAARERFRLNTPIAAIGVRGTDFVVSASSQAVRALVNEGAIVMAPFSDNCLATAFGPCAANAVELSQDSLQVVELSGSTPLPRLLPATDERGDLAPEDTQVQIAQADTDSARADEKTAGTEVYLENVTSRRVAEEAISVASRPAIKPPVPDPVVVDFTPGEALTASALTANNLVWGRWSGNDGQGKLERISVAYDVASAGRDVTVGNLARSYVLFRDSHGSTLVKPDLGVVSFGLDSAQAFYHSSTGVVAMQVNSGDLAIDFNRKSFSTSLGLDSAASGKVDFSATGQYNDGGYFFSNTDSQMVRGAISLDASEAGYLFEKSLGSGNSVEGITLWGSQ